MNDSKRHGTRIFKKATPNGKLTVYLGKRDFIDHLSHVDPIEGVVLLDPEYVKGRKVFVHLLCAFRHGREENDFLGVNRDNHRELFLNTKQIFPPIACQETAPSVAADFAFENKQNKEDDSMMSGRNDVGTGMSRLQDRLVRKLGSNTYPFSFKLPSYTPASVTLLLQSSESGKPYRVDYELKVYVADDEESKSQKRNSVRMVIRKLTFAPEEPGPQPSAEISREFLMSIGNLRVEATLDKQKYYHGEYIVVNVLVDNNSTKTVKKIRLTVRQYAQICLPNSNQYKCNVAEIHSEEGFPISPSQTGWCKVYRLCPLLDTNREKSGLALDGDLKNEDTNLASSTIISPKSSRDAMGIIVQYKVKIRLYLGFGLSDACLELPLILTHPNNNNNMNCDLSDEQLDLQSEWQTSRHSEMIERNGREEREEGHTNNSSLQIELLLATAPQMGVLARKVSRGISTPPQVITSHIAEFRRASDMPDGMAAFCEMQQPSLRPVNPNPPSPFALFAAELNASAAILPSSDRLPFPTEKRIPSGYSLPTTPVQRPMPTPLAQFVTPQCISSRASNSLILSDFFINSAGAPITSTNQSAVVNQDDLIFEDFARLRLMSQQQKQTLLMKPP